MTWVEGQNGREERRRKTYISKAACNLEVACTGHNHRLDRHDTALTLTHNNQSKDHSTRLDSVPLLAFPAGDTQDLLQVAFFDNRRI